MIKDIYFYGVYTSFILNFIMFYNIIRFNKNTNKERQDYIVVHYFLTFLSWLGIIAIIIAWFTVDKNVKSKKW